MREPLTQEASHLMRLKHLLMFALMLLIALIPWIIGSLCKRNYFHYVERFNQNSGIHIQILSYEQGWLHSQATIRVDIEHVLVSDLHKLNAPLMALIRPVSLTIHESIQHGPIVYNRIAQRFSIGYANIQSDLTLPADFALNFVTRLSSQGPIKIDTISRFNNRWQTHLAIPRLDMVIAPNAQATIDGILGTIDLQLKRNAKLIHLQFQLGAATIDHLQSSFANKISTNPFDYRYNATLQNGLLTGSTLIHLNQVAVWRPDNSIYTADRLILRNIFSIDDRILYNTSASIYIAKLNAVNSVVPLTSKIKINIKANNFDANGLNAYIEKLSNISPDLTTELNAMVLADIIMHAINSNSNVVADLTASTDLGKVSANAKMKWLAPIKLTFMDIVHLALIQIDIRAEKPFVMHVLDVYGKEIDDSTDASARALLLKNKKNGGLLPVNPTPRSRSEAILKAMLGVGYLQQDNNDLLTTLTIQDGVWRMNGWIVSH